MMADAAKRKVDVLLFWSLDRLTREGALETLQYLNTLNSYGVGFRSFTEPYLDSFGIFKDAVIAILGTVAKQERVRLSERVRAGLDRARAHGSRSGNAIGRPKVIFDRDRVVALRREGLSWSAIARKTSVGITTVRRACQAATDAPAPCQNRPAEAL
jgi:DNA invertase Pin-like site-specific DNA recombinase